MIVTWRASHCGPRILSDPTDIARGYVTCFVQWNFSLKWLYVVGLPYKKSHEESTPQIAILHLESVPWVESYREDLHVPGSLVSILAYPEWASCSQTADHEGENKFLEVKSLRLGALYYTAIADWYKGSELVDQAQRSVTKIGVQKISWSVLHR